MKWYGRHTWDKGSSRKSGESCERNICFQTIFFTFVIYILNPSQDVKERNTLEEYCSGVEALIDLEAIAHNVREIRGIIKPLCRMMGVVKADAYGHGAVEVSRVLLANGVDRLSVAMLDEAKQLRSHKIQAPILILGHTSEDLADELVRLNLTQTVFSLRSAEALSAAANRQGTKVKVHVKVDTGMGRLGFLPGRDAVECIRRIQSLKNIEVEGVFTHFASSDEQDQSYTKRQIGVFLHFTKQLDQAGIRIPIKHAANSAGIMEAEDSHLDLVRPGLILYGMYPSENVRKHRLALKPAMSLRTRISYIGKTEPDIPADSGKRCIAVIPTGFAFGFARNLSSRAKVIIRGQLAPVVGEIGMEECMVDVSHIGGVQAGDEVTLMGRQASLAVSAEDLALIMGTINYEVVCRLGNRARRVYTR